MSQILYTLFVSCTLLLPSELPESDSWVQSKGDGARPDSGWSIGTTERDYVYNGDNWRVIVGINSEDVPDYIIDDLPNAQRSYLIISEEKEKSGVAGELIEKIVLRASKKCMGSVVETPIYRSLIDNNGKVLKQI